MFPRILHIYGPLWINSYGVMIAIGFLAFLYLFYKDDVRQKVIEDELFFNAIFYSLLVGIIGGRVFSVATSFHFFKDNLIEIFYPWIGGFGILGAIFAVLIFGFLYLKKHNVSAVLLLDRAVIYAPLMQAVGRWGCFFAGCCYGSVSTNSCCSVIFTNVHGLAPIHVPLHPTQLYFSFVSFLTFLLMYFVFQRIFKKPGQLIFIYLILEGLSRFYLDFYRGDKLPFIQKCFASFCLDISKVQLISFFLFIFSIVGLVFVSIKPSRNK